MSRWLKCTSMYFNTDWNKYDDRLMKAVERGEVEKVAAVLSKKGVVPTKLDVEGRSAFHTAASRGHLECLNLILTHGVDATATDATGKNALHLAARNGQSLCVQKLLQHNCPVGNVDLQGRTALHDAVMAGCSSSVKLLCDGGASVNATDFDGRTPLVLATQMCHPRICQLLLERGADITVRDKQSKTALILGSEYSCKDAVEVLLKSGADVTAVDSFGHDSYHYARISKNQELVALVKSYLDNAMKVKEAARMEQKKRQQSVEMNAEAATNRDQIIHDLERQNESQQESLRKFHQEKRALQDQVNLLQQQLNQEKSAAQDIQKEREKLKQQLSVKEREDGARGIETVKVQLRSHLGDYSGQSVIKGKENLLVRQSLSLDSAQTHQPSSPSLSRPLEFSRSVAGSSDESNILRVELENTRKRQQTAEEEVGRLQVALARKTQDYEELAQSHDATKREADRQIQELEAALGDVQKRMMDSEAKVKQLQAHVVAVKEHLGNQMVDDLKAQLNDVKAKYEGASDEVGRLRNHLKQSEKALEEYKKSEGLLAVEAERLTAELHALKEEHEEMADTLIVMEAHTKELEARLASVVPGEKFDNMKNLLTNAVDEKEKQLAELREDYDRVLEEVAELHREMDNQDGVSLQEHERVKAALEEQNTALKKKLADVTSKSQALIREVQDSEEEKEILQEELQDLSKKLQTQFIPLEFHEEEKTSLLHTVEKLKEKLAEVTERSSQFEEELIKLKEEKASLCENMTNLKSTYIPSERFENEMAALLSRNAELEKELKSLQQKYEDKESELDNVVTENMSLKQSLQGEFVTKEEHENMRAELTEVLEKARAEIAKMEEDEKVREEELRKVKEGNATLKEQFEKVRTKLEKDYISLMDHEIMKSKLTNALSEAEGRAKEALSKYQTSQDNMVKLHQEIEAQKKELDTIQEAINSKFVPVSVMVDKENSFNTALKDMVEKLDEMQEKYNHEKIEGEQQRMEKEKLMMAMESGFVSSEEYREMETRYKSKMEELSLKLVDLEQQYKEVTVQRAELEERNALCDGEIQSLKQKLENENVRLEQFQAMQSTLTGSIQEVQVECERLREAHRLEVQRVKDLESELQNHLSSPALVGDHLQAKEALEKEVAQLQLSLREEEESSAQRAEDVAALQTELLQATQALEDLRKQTSQMAELQAEKQRLEEEVSDLCDRLSSLEEQYEELHREAAQAREDENRARSETQSLQTKSTSIEREIRELKDRYDDSLSTIGDLQRRIQTSSEQTEAKDKRITELLADVERLKQALNGLSQLAYAGNTPNKRQTQHIDTLQAQVKSLQQQLADAERQHREVISIYRTHLLSAAQGHMDEDVQAALLQIIRMRQEFVC